MKVREQRDRLKMTQAELAKVLGVSTNAVARWERGERKTTKMHELAIECIMRRRNIVT